VLSRHLLLVALCFFSPSFFFLVFLLRLHQTLARRNHLPCFLLRLHQTLARRNHLPCFSPSVTSNRVNATNRVNTASLFFSFGYVKKKTETKKEKKKKKKKEKG
jgi:hypothetical protein